MMNFRKRINELKASLSSARSAVRSGRLAVSDAEDDLENAEEARRIVQAVGEAVQREAHSRLAGVVSSCLSAVFDEPYEFRIRFEKKRNQTEANLVFVRDGVEVDPMDAAGGGVVDVASFALRMASMTLKRPALRRLLVLDEPFRFVSQGYRSRVRQMLQGLAEQMESQILMVTHVPELVAGKVVEM